MFRNGFCWLLVKPPGPLHAYVAPVEVEMDDSCKSKPEQIGPLLEATGVTGAAGLVNVNGPAALDVQPFNVTLTSEYTPADKLLRFICPLASALAVDVTGAPPFLI